MEKYINVNKIPFELHKGWDIFIAYKSDVDKMPYEDIEEKRYANWIDENINDGTIYCSKCRTVEKPSDSQYKSPRCPNCGAHMR